MHYDEIVFEIDAIEGSGYQVRVAPPHRDVIVMPFRLPFGERGLDEVLDDVELAVLKGSGRRRRIQSADVKVVEEFGRQLFESLLVDEARVAYYDARQRAAEAEAGLRLRLLCRPPELDLIPWEFLYDPRQLEFVSLSRTTPFVRHLSSPMPMPTMIVEGPLRVLGMASSPSPLASLDLEAEQQRVHDALGTLIERGLVELTWVEGQTWRHLQDKLREAGWHVFHFIGHGQFSTADDEGFLALANDEGGMHLISATQLSRLTTAVPTLRLVVLNACEGARGSAHDAFAGVATRLVRGNTPAVLAMQYEISDSAAIEFSRSFYEALADGQPLDAAVAEGRVGVSLAVSDSLEWATPVLYMRSSEGTLFDLQARTAEAAPAAPSEPAAGAVAERRRLGTRGLMATVLLAVVATVIGLVLLLSGGGEPEPVQIATREVVDAAGVIGHEIPEAWQVDGSLTPSIETPDGPLAVLAHLAVAPELVADPAAPFAELWVVDFQGSSLDLMRLMVETMGCTVRSQDEDGTYGENGLSGVLTNCGGAAIEATLGVGRPDELGFRDFLIHWTQGAELLDDAERDYLLWGWFLR